MTASSVHYQNGNGIKPLNGINNAAAKPVISTNKTDATNGHGYDENDLVSSTIVKPHNGYVRQCSKSNGCSEFETQSNRLNTFYNQLSAKNGFNHSTISIINNKKSINGNTTTKAVNETHLDYNGSKSNGFVNGSSTMENGDLNEYVTLSNNRAVSNGNGVSTLHEDVVNIEGVCNGNVNNFTKSKTPGKIIWDY